MGWGSWARRLTAVAAAGLACGIVLADPVGAQTRADPNRLNAEVLRLHQAGKCAEATEIAKRAGCPLRDDGSGPGHRDVGTALNNLSRAVPGTGTRRRGGTGVPAQPRHPREGDGARPAPSVAQALGNLANLYQMLGRYLEEADVREPSQPRRSREGGGTRAHQSCRHAAEQHRRKPYRAQGRYPEAGEPLYRRSLAIAPEGAGAWARQRSAGGHEPGLGVPGAEPLPTRPSPRSGATSPRPRRALGPRAPPAPPPRSTAWPRRTQGRAAAARPSPCTGAASPSSREVARPRAPSGSAPGAERPRRAVPGAGVPSRHHREGGGAGAPGRNAVDKQPGRVPSTEPTRRGRVPVPPQPGYPPGPAPPLDR